MLSKLVDDFSQALRASTIAKLYFMAWLQCPFCERLCEGFGSNGSDFHSLARSFCYASQKLAEVFACKHSHKRLRRILQIIHNIFAVLDAPFRYPLRNITLKVGVKVVREVEID